MAAQALMHSHAPARTPPLWLFPTDPSNTVLRWFILPPIHIPNGSVSPLNNRLTTQSELKNFLPDVPLDDFLDASFIERSGFTPLDVIDALSESMPSIQSDLEILMTRVSEAALKRNSSAVASVCHSLQGVSAQYGDLKIRRLLQKWSPGLKDKSLNLTVTDIAALETAIQQSVQSITLYRVALDWEVAENSSA